MNKTNLINATLTILSAVLLCSSVFSDTINGNLDIEGKLYVKEEYPAVTTNGTRYFKQAEIREPRFNIPSGVTDNGYRIGLAVQGYVYTSDFGGNLQSQFGAWIRTGANSNAPTGDIINSYGIYLENLTGANVDIQNSFGLFQSSASSRNYFAGDVGIGTTNPHFGDITYGSPHTALHVVNPGSSGTFRPIARFQSGTDANNTGAAIVINHSNDRGLILEAGRGLNDQAVAYFGLVNSGGSVSRFMSAVQGGRVGIGTDQPSHELSVNGTIQAKEVIIETGWSDFVFEDSYQLRSLNEVETHIEEHGHLPDVPSAATIQSEGLSVGEAQKIMMQKIEELTLYVIEQDKKISAQQKEIEKLKVN